MPFPSMLNPISIHPQRQLPIPVKPPYRDRPDHNRHSWHDNLLLCRYSERLLHFQPRQIVQSVAILMPIQHYPIPHKPAVLDICCDMDIHQQTLETEDLQKLHSDGLALNCNCIQCYDILVDASADCVFRAGGYHRYGGFGLWDYSGVFGGRGHLERGYQMYEAALKMIFIYANFYSVLPHLNPCKLKKFRNLS
jgi:hypothetical protein